MLALKGFNETLEDLHDVLINVIVPSYGMRWDGMGWYGAGWDRMGLDGME